MGYSSMDFGGGSWYHCTWNGLRPLLWVYCSQIGPNQMDKRRPPDQFRDPVYNDDSGDSHRDNRDGGHLTLEVVRTLLIIFAVFVAGGLVLVGMGRDGLIVNMLTHAFTALVTAMLTLLGVARKPRG